VEMGRYLLDKNKRTLSLGRKSIKLTEKEQDIIIYLFGKKEGASKKDIMKDIWSYSAEVDTHTYETHLYRLRQKIQSKLKDKKFIEALKCIRCGACLNACPIYKNVGGYTYNTTYSGPIGSVITPFLKGFEDFNHLSFACSTCGACTEVCPVKVPLHDLLLENRSKTVEQNLGKQSWNIGMKG